LRENADQDPSPSPGALGPHRHQQYQLIILRLFGLTGIMLDRSGAATSWPLVAAMDPMRSRPAALASRPCRMLMAALRLNIPVIFASGGPMEAGKTRLAGKEVKVDLISAMKKAGDRNVSDEDVANIERSACPTRGSCSGMFTDRGARAWTPQARERSVSLALQAYAALTTSAARGAVRDLSQFWSAADRRSSVAMADPTIERARVPGVCPLG
jgi:hypothetical protein